MLTHALRQLPVWLIFGVRQKIMKCPHCLTGFHDNKEVSVIGEQSDARFRLVKRHCPECRRLIISLLHDTGPYGRSETLYHYTKESLCYPRAVSRAPLSPEVPKAFADDYQEACLTLADSPKASAALSRRCLQHLLREVHKVRKGNLADEIQQAIDAKQLPSYILESLDAIRNIGNFAAHPLKSTSSGEVLEVEPGEAEWTLDVLEGLFDFFFVQPALLAKKRAALDAKLAAAGKPKMK